ncbi:MAG TPA: hypothetical protein VLM83_00785, partial [Anaerolineales bacterium]|nr:hypothetical protein [Anaerolineales bacterium]
TAFTILALILVGVVFLHMFVEKPRWQMAPAFMLAVLLLGKVVFDPFPRSSQPVRQKGRGLAGNLLEWLWRFTAVVLFILGVILPWALPVFRLPEPGGPYAIGMRSMEMVDGSRGEALTPEAGDRRALMVHAWYPAQPQPGAQTQPYWSEVERVGPMILERLGLPTFLLSHLPLVKTHSYPGAPLAGDSGSYPVVIFSHGYSADYAFYWTQYEALASQGYIVFSISHPYEAIETVYPDGRLAFMNDATWAMLFGGSLGNLDLDERVLVWAADTRFVLDRLEAMNAEAGNFFAGRLDMERVGIYGMSFGGATAMLVCLDEPRCKAAANLDGSPFGEAAFQGRSLQVPSMFFYSQDAFGDSDDIYAAVENRAYRVYIRGSEHSSYTEVGYWSPLARHAAAYLPFGLGEVQPERMSEIVNAYLVAFFDRHLKGEEGGLLDGEGVFGEVESEER